MLSNLQHNAILTQFAHGAMLLPSRQLATLSRTPKDFHQLSSNALLLRLNQRMRKMRKMNKMKLQRPSSASGSIT